MQDRPRIQSNIHMIWKLKVSPRIKVFGWLVLSNRLLTIDNLNKRGWPLVNRCVLCKNQSESVKHMLDECNYSRPVYCELARCIPDKMPTQQTLSLQQKF